MSNCIFNSREKQYKSKFGAVCAGEDVLFRLLLPCYDNHFCTGAFLLLCKDGKEEERFELCATDSYQDNHRWWEITKSVAESGLYWYHFEYSTPFGNCRISNDGDGIGYVSDYGASWQLTVYSPDFKTPEWLKGGVIYQIFPDRFAKSENSKGAVPADRIMRDDWGGEPLWKPTNDGKVLNNDFFGGDLKGIEQKLDYLKELGVTCIYLNPIFESASNHRYDTADYEKVDSILGTQDDFTSLCTKAKAKGIHIIIDGVFNHTGDNSKYFNKYKKYGTGGAYNSKQSPYYKWYNFNNWPDDYSSWWGINILPQVNEECPEYLDFITGEGGIIEKWLKAGADGWRLDVADELPDIFLDKLRKRSKAVNPDALVLGEVWEDASNKTSYGFRRRYLLGEQLDSVMNYPFLNAVVDFVLSYRTDDFFARILSVLENYPPQVINVLMNPLGTHDTQRILTVLAGLSCNYKDRQWQSKNKLTPEQKNAALKLLTLASALQFTLPGVPSIYYGDEAGIEGFKDPFNRTCYPWGYENQSLIEWYKFLGKLRHDCPALSDGEFVPISAALGCVAFARVKGNDIIVVIANRNEHDIDYYLNDDRFDNLQSISGCSVNSRSVRIAAMTCAILGNGDWI
ncbi:MAG: glycoside hydrolase family 13 protein [Oscillospiraceae bacterium]